MTYLSKEYKIILECGISCAWNGKSIANTINRLDNNTILIPTRQIVCEANDAIDEDKKNFLLLLVCICIQICYQMMMINLKNTPMSRNVFVYWGMIKMMIVQSWLKR